MTFDGVPFPTHEDHVLEAATMVLAEQVGRTLMSKRVMPTLAPEESS